MPARLVGRCAASLALARYSTITSLGNKRHREPNAQGKDDEIVEVADDGDEVGNEVDRRQRIGCNGNGEGLCVPRHAWIARGQIDGVTVSMDVLRAQVFTWESIARSTVDGFMRSYTSLQMTPARIVII